MNMRTHSFAQLLGMPKTQPSKLAVKVKPASAKSAPARTQSAKVQPIATKATTKPKATSFAHLQPADDAGEFDHVTTTPGSVAPGSKASAILAAAAKARTPTSRKPPAASSAAGQIIAAGKKRRGEA